MFLLLSIWLCYVLMPMLYKNLIFFMSLLQDWNLADSSVPNLWWYSLMELADLSSAKHFQLQS